MGLKQKISSFPPNTRLTLVVTILVRSLLGAHKNNMGSERMRKNLLLTLSLFSSPSRCLSIYRRVLVSTTATAAFSSNPRMSPQATPGKTDKFWDWIAERYAKTPIKDEEAYAKKLQITQSYLNKDMEVLEYGCGTGSTSLIHAPFVKHILATDISANMLEIAKKKKEDSNVDNVDFQQSSIEELQLPDASKDVVLGLSILHLLKNRDEVLAKTHQWLKPGGLFVTSTPCIGEMGAGIKFLVNAFMPIGHFFGVLPHVSTITKTDLKESLAKNGFSIEYEWQPKPDAAVFIIGRKGA
jgi:ubiquinone/menaquinone biosynthesis C-methylase UbiE